MLSSVTLVTGATGFIGSHVLRALLERGDRVRAMRRSSSYIAHLADLEDDVDWVSADVLDRRGLRKAVTRDVAKVFHLAGTTSLRLPAEDVFRINVQGTRMLLEECLRAGVERVIHTSSVVAVGPGTRERAADETQVFTAGRLGIPYVNSKREAEVEAIKACAQGLPVVIVNPAHTLGTGDHGRSSTEVVRRFLLRRMPAYVDGAINIVDVRDVAAGHLLADENGRAGERYILGNRNYTWERLFADLGRLSGIEPPAVRLPAQVAEALAETLSRLPGPTVATPIEVRAAAQWWTYRNTKAKRELGFTTGAHEDTVEQTVAWLREREGVRLAGIGRRQPLALRLTGFAVRQFEEAASRVVPR